MDGQKPYFSFDEGVSYKLTFLSPKFKEVQKDFGDGPITKFEFEKVKIKGSDGTDYEGVLEVGKKIMKYLKHNHEPDAVYNVSRTGAGKETDYNISKDF